MIAVLLCPGPSLARLAPEALAAYGFRVGINRAAIAFECHVFAAMDYPVLRDWQHAVLGTPALLTRRQTWLDLRGRLRFTDVRLVEDFACPVPDWQEKTATCALAMLGTMGVLRIDVYGADWTPGPDWDGGLAGEDRTPERWTKEATVWGGMVEWLAGRGVTVERIQPS